VAGKKISSIFYARDERVALIDWEQKELPISTQARLLHLNRSSLYYQPMPPSPEEVAFKRRSDEIFTECPCYGYRKIAAQLHREGRAINEKTVAKYMREMGLMAIYPGPNRESNVHIKQEFIPTCSEILPLLHQIISGVLILRLFVYKKAGCIWLRCSIGTHALLSVGNEIKACLFHW